MYFILVNPKTHRSDTCFESVRVIGVKRADFTGVNLVVKLGIFEDRSFTLLVGALFGQLLFG